MSWSYIYQIRFIKKIGFYSITICDIIIAYYSITLCDITIQIVTHRVD